MFREKLKLLEHDYNQMSAMFKFKRTELEQKVTELSQELQDMHQTTSKEPGQIHTVQFLPQFLSSTHKNCISRNSGDISNEADNFLRANGFAKEENTNGKRLCSRRGLANVSYGRPNLQKLRQEGQTVSAPTLCQNDQHNAAFSGLETLKKVCGGDICNKADSSSMTSGCAAEESANGTRIYSRRALINVSNSTFELQKFRQEGQTVSAPTLCQSGDIYNESDISLRSNGCATNENTSEKRTCSKRRSVSITCRKRNLHITLEQGEENFTGDISNETESSSRINGSANGGNRNGKRACSRRHSANVNHKEPNLHTELRQEKNAVSAPTSCHSDQHSESFSGVDTLEKLCEEGQELHIDIPQSKVLHEDLPEPFEGQKHGFLSVTEVTSVTGKATNVKHQKQENAPCHGSSLNAACSEVNHLSRRSSSTGRPVRRHSANVNYREPNLHTKLRQEKNAVSAPTSCHSDQHSESFSGVDTLEKVCEEEGQELHIDIPQSEVLHEDLPEPFEGQNHGFLSVIEVTSVTGKATNVKHQNQENAPCHSSSLNATCSEVNHLSRRSSSTGRPVRRASGAVASYKEPPLNIKMRRSQ
eukprot:Gb_03291 [translate_table: standard]